MIPANQGSSIRGVELYGRSDGTRRYVPGGAILIVVGLLFCSAACLTCAEMGSVDREAMSHYGFPDLCTVSREVAGGFNAPERRRVDRRSEMGRLSRQEVRVYDGPSRVRFV